MSDHVCPFMGSLVLSRWVQTRRGLGLLSMRERLRLVNGTISFERVEPSGTRIDVRIPLPDSEQQ